MPAKAKHRSQIWNSNQHPYKHTLSEFTYVNPALPGVTSVEQAFNWMIAVIYPNTKTPVATPALLPLTGNTLNDYRIVQNDGDGKASSYRWEQREGEGSASWHKVYDMDWGRDSILTAFLEVTQDLYVYKNGKRDLDAAGNPVVGNLSGQHVYGGDVAGTNLILHANSGDGVGPQTGFVKTADNVAPTLDNLFSLGVITKRFQFGGDRQRNIEMTSANALNLLRKKLLEEFN